MKRTTLVAMMAVGLGACGTGGVQAPVARAPFPERAVLGEGVLVEVALRESLGASSTRVGERFSADLVAPIVGHAGEIVMPGSVTVHGRVTGITQTPAGAAAAIAVDIDRLVHRGRSQPMRGGIVEVDVASSLDFDAAPAAPPAGATAVGAILTPAQAASLPGLRPAVSGGTAISLGLEGEEAVLPAGTRLRMHLWDVLVLE